MNHHGHHHHHAHSVLPHTTTTTSPTTTTHSVTPPSSHVHTHRHFHSTAASVPHHQFFTEESLQNLHEGHGHHHGGDHDLHQLHGNGLGSSTSEGGHMNHGDHTTDHGAIVFKWARDVNVLFEQWTTRTVLELVLAMVIAAFMAALYDVLRNYLSSWDNAHVNVKMPTLRRICLRFYRSFMHALTAAIGYIQMLFAMTYDLRIFIAIILGSGIGFFVLGPYFRRRRAEQKETAVQEIPIEGEESFAAEGQEVTQSLLSLQGQGQQEVKAETHGDPRSSVIVLEEAALRRLIYLEDTVV